ncbi:ATP-binding protein [Pseudorhodobacter sp. W20_MBD10_FR17]|uniref:ATP-binding protein n=1 Tax=Pseudorhodobacter sp. W20_MBD10_FR17 TaxID=3240266 RepID=UPI003F96A56D
MTVHSFHMPKLLDDVDPMVMALASKVDDILPMEARFRFEVSVSEALTNLVIHANTDAKDPIIDIRLTLGDTTVTLEAFDPSGAAPFDIRAHAPDLSQINPSVENGRGLGLIMECADSVDYGPVAHKNRLKLTFTARP